jgi:hypothetical protein
VPLIDVHEHDAAVFQIADSAGDEASSHHLFQHDRDGQSRQGTHGHDSGLFTQSPGVLHALSALSVPCETKRHGRMACFDTSTNTLRH